MAPYQKAPLVPRYTADQRERILSNASAHAKEIASMSAGRDSPTQTQQSSALSEPGTPLDQQSGQDQQAGQNQQASQSQQAAQNQQGSQNQQATQNASSGQSVQAPTPATSPENSDGSRSPAPETPSRSAKTPPAPGAPRRPLQESVNRDTSAIPRLSFDQIRTEHLQKARDQTAVNKGFNLINSQIFESAYSQKGSPKTWQLNLWKNITDPDSQIERLDLIDTIQRIIGPHTRIIDVCPNKALRDEWNEVHPRNFSTAFLRHIRLCLEHTKKLREGEPDKSVVEAQKKRTADLRSAVRHEEMKLKDGERRLLKAREEYERTRSLLERVQGEVERTKAALGEAERELQDWLSQE